MSVFLDSGVFFAAAHAGDASHERALRLLQTIGSEDAITSDHVVVECWNLLNRKLGRHVAMRFWRGLRYAPLRIEFVAAADLERAEAIAGSWLDQTFSIVDCTSFALMERTGCSRVASFDSDFAVYRFGPDATRAFEVLR
jgi:uncharacterized protein